MSLVELPAMIRVVALVCFSFPIALHAQNVVPTAARQSAPALASANSDNQLPDSTKLDILHAVEPAYPLVAVKRKLQGPVVLKAAIDERGEIQGVSVVSGDPLLAEAATQAVKQWKFAPFIKGGSPVKVSASVPFSFIFIDKGSAVPHLDDAAMKIIWLSKENTAHLKILNRVEPVYPPVAKSTRVQGAVILTVVIGKDGGIHQINVLSGHPFLVDAAVAAVKQWRYQPYVFNGEPVEIQSEISVNFSIAEKY